MQQVIELAKYYLDLGYDINEAITTAINIAREKNIELYERGEIENEKN